MRAIDTNVLVRLIARDHEKQVSAAEAFVSSGAWVSHFVLAETTWVLSSVYDLDDAQIVNAVHMLLNHQNLTIQDADVVEAALTQYRLRPALGFSDCLVVEIAKKAGHVPVGTFDRALGKLFDTERL
jgi:predicted nucleic-acid-binding protein